MHFKQNKFLIQSGSITIRNVYRSHFWVVSLKPKLWELLDEWIMNSAFPQVNMEHDDYQSTIVPVRKLRAYDKLFSIKVPYCISGVYVDALVAMNRK